MTEIRIGGRVIPLLYTTCEMIEIQKDIGCTGFQLKDQVFGIYLADEDDPKSIRMKVATEAASVSAGTLIFSASSSMVSAMVKKPCSISHSLPALKELWMVIMPTEFLSKMA